MSKKRARELLWQQNILHWKLDSNQKTMYDALMISKKKIDVLVCSRQIGKSWLLLTYAIECCLRKPNTAVKMIAPQLQMIRKIVQSNLNEILVDCPKDLVPTAPNTTTNTIKFKNGSEIQLAGTDSGNADTLRGTKAHLVIVDEAAFCDDLDYIIKSILVPMTTTTKGKIILCSTPPKTNDHAFIRFWERAEIDNTLIKRTVHDCPRLSQDEIQMLAEASGGFDSVEFRREYLCEKIVSEEDAVIPEFTSELAERVVKPWPRPAYYDAYASMDIGVRDLTVVLFAYYDYKNAKLIIEDELVENGKTLLADKFGNAIIKKETELWVHPITKEPKKPYLRISDNNNLQFLNEIYDKCKITFLPTHKLEADAALNNMRMMLKNERVVINPRCKVLISHLKNAIWNKARTSYVRSQDNGHYDAIDSLKYLCKNVNYSKDPYPLAYKNDKKDEIFFSESAQHPDKLAQTLINMFQAKKPKKFNK